VLIRRRIYSDVKKNGEVIDLPPMIRKVGKFSKLNNNPSVE